MLATGNRLLDTLSPLLRADLLAHARPVSLPLRASLSVTDEAPAFAYFLTSGVASVVVTGDQGRSIEVEVLGHEGVSGLLHLLGPATVPMECFMQLAGTGFRLPSTDLRTLFATSDELRARLLEFLQFQAITVRQIAGCHRLHGADQRLARWLLMMSDRTGGSELSLTQEFLGEMLGTQRTTVSAVAATLQTAGTLEYSRGRIHILDRAALKRAACSCYPVVHTLLTHLYAAAVSPANPHAHHFS